MKTAGELEFIKNVPTLASVPNTQVVVEDKKKISEPVIIEEEKPQLIEVEEVAEKTQDDAELSDNDVQVVDYQDVSVDEVLSDMGISNDDKVVESNESSTNADEIQAEKQIEPELEDVPEISLDEINAQMALEADNFAAQNSIEFEVQKELEIAKAEETNKPLAAQRMSIFDNPGAKESFATNSDVKKIIDILGGDITDIHVKRPE